MDVHYTELLERAESVVKAVPPDRRASLEILFSEVDGVGLLRMVLDLHEEGKSDKEIYSSMWQHIEKVGGYDGKR